MTAKDGLAHQPRMQYLVSVYWAVMTLTGIGYGDVTASNVLEFYLCSLAQLFGATFWAYVVASIISVVSLINSHGVKFQQTMDDLNGMMQVQHWR